MIAHRSRARLAAAAAAAAALGALSAVAVTAAAPGQAWAAEEGGVAYAIQPRKFLLSHEFSFNVGVLPMDAFYKGIALGGAYTYHFSEALAWEVAQFTYSLNIDTRLEARLRNDFNPPVKRIPEPRLKYLATTSLVLKPFFGKMALVNKTIIHMEIFAVVGGGIAKPSSPGVRPTIDVGLGLRFFGWKHVSFRFDLRDYASFEGLSLVHYLCITLGVSPAFGEFRAARAPRPTGEPDVGAPATLPSLEGGEG
jgi:outer membrane beta-barrel protein